MMYNGETRRKTMDKKMQEQREALAEFTAPDYIMTKAEADSLAQKPPQRAFGGKSPAMEAALNAMAQKIFGRGRDALNCVSCGKAVNVATDFRDELSVREFGISHFCQECQDTVFGTPEACTECGSPHICCDTDGYSYCKEHCPNREQHGKYQIWDGKSAGGGTYERCE
jgi:hypothetical protein